MHASSPPGLYEIKGVFSCNLSDFAADKQPRAHDGVFQKLVMTKAEVFTPPAKLDSEAWNTDAWLVQF